MKQDMINSLPATPSLMITVYPPSSFIIFFLFHALSRLSGKTLQKIS